MWLKNLYATEIRLRDLPDFSAGELYSTVLIPGPCRFSIRALDFGGVDMSADGNLKVASVSLVPVTSEKSEAERTCPACKLPLRTHPSVLLRTGQSVHVECYFRMQKRARGERSN